MINKKVTEIRKAQQPTERRTNDRSFANQDIDNSPSNEFLPN